MSSCGLPNWLVREQYVNRASEAQTLCSIQLDGEGVRHRGAKMALAELIQIIFFAALTVLYSLAFTGYIPPRLVGIITLSLLQ